MRSTRTARGINIALWVLAASWMSAMPAAWGADDERGKLRFFEGTWTVKGSEATYREKCEWLPGGGFLACSGEDKLPAGNEYSFSVMGYSASESVYTYSNFSPRGTTRSERGLLQDGVWRFFSQSDRGPAWRRTLVTITPTSEGFHFRRENSDKAGPWAKVFETNYIRLK